MNGTVLGDRYRVDARIGSGGMAEVYRGEDPVLNRTVAIKILLPQFGRDASFVDRFRREAQAAARLNHPNVVAVYDTGADGETQWIVMEFIEGRTLHDLLASGRRPSPTQSCEIAERICEALTSAHAQGVIHRDIKPANVMVTRDGTVKLMDLGIARVVTGAITAPQTSAVLGTAAYMSPEQAQGQPVDARTDIYSLGAVLYELLTGRPPFTGDSPVAIAYKQVNEHPPVPSQLNPDVSPSLDAVVMRALSKNPANRYQTPQEFAQDLERARTGVDVTATPLLPVGDGPATQVIARPQPTSVLAPGEEPPGSSRRVWLGVLIGTLVVGLLAAAGFLLYLAFGDRGDLEPRPIPNVLNLTEDEARMALERAGFTMIETREKFVSDPSKEGLVVRVEPDVGTTHDPDTTTVNLSLGKLPPLVEVPDLEGKTLSEAQAALDELGLQLGSQTPEASDSIESGRITRSQPAAGEQVRKNTFVDVFVSSGPATVTVPDVTCRTFNAARNELQNEGFVVVNGGFAPINPACPNPNRVAAQDPAGNTQAERGSTVTLFTGEVTSPSPSPEEGG